MKKTNKKGQEVKFIKKKDLENIREYLLVNNKIHFLAFINVGVNIALRISDLREIRLEDIKNDYSFELMERKNKKKRVVVLNKTCIENIKLLKNFYKEIGFSDKKGYLFKSLSHYNMCHKIDRPITISGISKQFNTLQKTLKISYPIGSHSLRKTWGYNVYKKTKDIALVMKVLNHSSAEITLRYIGIEEEDIRAVFRKYEI